MALQLTVNGEQVEVADEGLSLLEVLRDRLGLRAAKDGCSPQGQCGCCTVWVDGEPRVACVTPARRVRNRSVTTMEGLSPDVHQAWTDAFTACGASQCGFCTPGIIMRLAALDDPSDGAKVDAALLAHLCRCTGWQTIREAARVVGAGAEVGAAAMDRRDLAAAARRASIEGGVPQDVGPHVAAGEGGFADDTSPLDAAVAVLDRSGSWVLGGSLSEARRGAGKVQGRRTTVEPCHPIEVPPGAWDVALQTTWVEPAYLEPDASWCAPGEAPASPLGNGGAFGGKALSPLAAAAERLARDHAAPIRALWSREDTVLLGGKRPPMAAGVNADGSGVMRIARTEGVAAAVRAVGPQIEVQEVDVAGPPTSAGIRGAGWVEAAVLMAAARAKRSGESASDGVEIQGPAGGRAMVRFDGERFDVTVECGEPLDEIVLRSYCIGAAHMGFSWVTSEGIAVDDDGRVHDLTVRSFGVVRARDMPRVDVAISPSGAAPVNGSDAVFAAVAAATWLHEGLPPRWPTRGRDS